MFCVCFELLFLVVLGVVVVVVVAVSQERHFFVVPFFSKLFIVADVEAWIAEVQNGEFAEILGSLPSNTTGQMLVRFTESRCVQL